MWSHVFFGTRCSFSMQCSVIQTYSHQIRMWLRLWLNFSSWIWLDVAQAGFAIVRPRSSTEKTTKWINGSKKQYTLERNMTSQWTETRSPVNFLTSMTGCLPQHLEANGSYHHYSWIHSMYGANDASCTSDGTTSYLTMKSCIVPACSTSRTSFASEDWVSIARLRRPCLYTFMSLSSCIAYLLSYNICKQQREFHMDFIELK